MYAEEWLQFQSSAGAHPPGLKVFDSSGRRLHLQRAHCTYMFGLGLSWPFSESESSCSVQAPSRTQDPDYVNMQCAATSGSFQEVRAKIQEDYKLHIAQSRHSFYCASSLTQIMRVP